MGKLIWVAFFIIAGAGNAGATEIVAEQKSTSCDSLTLYEELKVFKDPTIFLANLAMIDSDPAFGWKMLMRENPLLMTVKGKFEINRLGPTRAFNNFGAIAKVYEAAEPRLKLGEGVDGQTGTAAIVPIKICGLRSSYNDFLGFILEEDLKKALVNRISDSQMPPSTYPNPIPEWKASNLPQSE